MRWIAISCIVICLTSCGFQLRGQAPLSPPLKKLYIKTSSPYSELTRDLRDYLKLSGVQLVSSPKEASTVLDILSVAENQQLLSVSGTQQTRQYNLSLTVTFQVTSPSGVVLVAAQSVTENRALTTVSNQILSGSNEASSLFQQMRPDVIYDMMNRLGSEDVTEQLTKN